MIEWDGALEVRTWPAVRRLSSIRWVLIHRFGLPRAPYTHLMTGQHADLIVADPDVVHGQARIRGTRIPVSVILDCVAAGLSDDEILRQYPTLTVDGIRAAAAYGASLAREEIRPLPA